VFRCSVFRPVCIDLHVNSHDYEPLFGSVTACLNCGESGRCEGIRHVWGVRDVPRADV